MHMSCLLDEDLCSVLLNVEAFLSRYRYHSEVEGEGRRGWRRVSGLRSMAFGGV
jgi:hypothetical protein